MILLPTGEAHAYFKAAGKQLTLSDLVTDDDAEASSAFYIYDPHYAEESVHEKAKLQLETMETKKRIWDAMQQDASNILGDALESITPRVSHAMSAFSTSYMYFSYSARKSYSYKLQ